MTPPRCHHAATNLCFAERNVYTSEVLAVVMQQLMEQSPLPMLLMRTVIQALTMYPRLGGFVMNILSRLIMKQVCPACRLSGLPSVQAASSSRRGLVVLGGFLRVGSCCPWRSQLLWVGLVAPSRCPQGCLCVPVSLLASVCPGVPM